MAADFASGCLGFLLMAIFWPLLFPLALHGSSRCEDAIAVAMPAVLFFFAACGFLVCRGVTKRFVRDDGHDATSLFR